MFRFANPIALVLLLLPLIVWLVHYFFRNNRLARPAVVFSDLSRVVGLKSGWRTEFVWVPDALRLMVWILLVIVLARPQSGQEREVIRGQGIDIVMALDISVSMAEQDILPSRFEVAKEQIEDFVLGREFDRIGLVMFASDAYHYIPPTLDYDLFVERLSRVQLINSYGLDASGTAIGTGIASAANMLRSSNADSRIVILLTDGSNTVGSVNPLDAARAAAALGVRVYTIGMGRAAFGQSGQVLSSEFDEAALQEIAEIADGLYFRVEDASGLQRTYEQIDALERTEIEQQVFVNWRDRSSTLMLIALVFLLLERILRVTVFQAVP
ncbi:MAG: VWA domain-containing protein [Chloroflexota bacterium]